MRRALAAGMGMVVDEVAHRAQVRGIFGQGGGDGRFERAGAVAGEQRQQPAGEHAQVGAALGGAQEQRLGAGCGVMQAVLRAVGAGGALVATRASTWAGILDLRAAVEAARVGGDQLLRRRGCARYRGWRAR